jgi:hypothetical protein
MHSSIETRPSLQASPMKTSGVPDMLIQTFVRIAQDLHEYLHLM